MASPPGFTSAPRSKHARAYAEMETLDLGNDRQRLLDEAKERLDAIQTILKNIEFHLRDMFPELRFVPLSEALIEKFAPQLAKRYARLVENRDKAKAAYDALLPKSIQPATVDVSPAGQTESTVLKGVKTAVGTPLQDRPRGGSTRKHRRRKQWTSSATRTRSSRSASKTRRGASSMTSSGKSTSTGRKSGSARVF